MTKFEIGYNPYTYEYRFTKNGIEIKGDQSKLYSKSENRYRIQQLITPERNWSGLFSEIQKECNDNDIQIIFHGVMHYISVQVIDFSLFTPFERLKA